MSEVSIRRYDADDAPAVARLFGERYGAFVGPIEVTAESWHRMYTEGWWNCPSLETDPDCVQVAESAGELVGYVAFWCDPAKRPGEGILQELVVADCEAGADLAARLLEHAESIMASRGADRVTALCGDEDLPLCARLDSAGYGRQPRSFSVFMLAVVDLAGLLRRLAPRLAERARTAARSGMEPPAGGLTISSPNHSATVTFNKRGLDVREGPDDGSDGDGAVFELSEAALVGLVTGSLRAEDAFLDGRESMRVVRAGSLGARAVEFLGALFPRLPHAIIRAHSW